MDNESFPDDPYRPAKRKKTSAQPPCITELGEPCQRCLARGQTCIRDAQKPRFRIVSRPHKFPREQHWVDTSHTSTSPVYVDETSYIEAIHDDSVGEHDERTGVDENPESYRSIDNGTERITSLRHRESQSEEEDLLLGRGLLEIPDDSRSPIFNASVTHRSSPPNPYYGLPGTQRSYAAFASSQTTSWLALSPTQPRQPASIEASTPDSACESARVGLWFSPLIKQNTPLDHDRLREDRLKAALNRHYINNLSTWFDLCDPSRSFQEKVPLRAQHCPPLMSAIFTTSARLLLRTGRHKNEYRSAQDGRHPAAELEEKMAVQFHNECIRDLLRLSMDPAQVHNEDLLAAAIILRTDEELDALSREAGDSVFLAVIHAYINAQVSFVFSMPQEPAGTTPKAALGSTQARTEPSLHHDLYSPTSGYLGPANVAVPENGGASKVISLREACFWVACRQEVYASFVKQRHITFPLSSCEMFRSLNPCDDHIWATRMVIFCADVLEFCYGSQDIAVRTPPTYVDVDCWRRLKARDTAICASLPLSFEPIFFCGARYDLDRVFPEIWYKESWHATGIGHMELARILLAVFNPSLPRLGIGRNAAKEELSLFLQGIVLRLCGIAMSNWSIPPNSINACIAIAMCGEYFTDSREQSALLNLLVTIEEEQGYPTRNIADELKKTWR